MLDTVGRTSIRPLLPHIAEAISKGDTQSTPGWEFSLYKDPASPSCSSSNWKLKGAHKQTGLFVHGVSTELRGWSVSLPGILHGFNGVQLKDDVEKETALLRVHQVLSEVADFPRLTETFRRLDICLNLAHNESERLVLALRNARHPWIRRVTQEYASGSIRFPGTEAVFQAYWKRPPLRSVPKRKAWHTPRVLRLELQLKNANKIAQFLDLEEPPITELPPMEVIYGKFREFMLGFQRYEQRTDKCSMPALLALCEAQDFRLPGGETAMDWYGHGVSKSGHSKMRAKVAAATAQFLDIDWAKLLPENFIPATVDVRLDGSKVPVPPSPIILPAPPSLVTFDDQEKFQRGLVNV